MTNFLQKLNFSLIVLLIACIPESFYRNFYCAAVSHCPYCQRDVGMASTSDFLTNDNKTYYTM